MNRRLGWTTLALMVWLATGCVGAPEADERAAGAETLGGKNLTLQADQTIGWPAGEDDYVSTMRIVSDDRSEATAAGDLLVLPKIHYQIDLDMDIHPWDSWGDVVTDMGFIILHRDRANASGAWASVTCGETFVIGFGDYITKNGYKLFAESATIDIQHGNLINNEGAAKPLADCGVTETDPEFAVFAIPVHDIGWSMEGTYRYELNATCDLRTCDNDRTYGAAVFTNNPVAGSTTAPATSSTNPSTVTSPSDRIRAYYQALGAGRVDEVVGMWVTLDAAAQARLRNIAANGQGWTWTVGAMTETIASNGQTATVTTPEIVATKGDLKYVWSGTIELKLQDNQWRISKMRLRQTQ